MISSLCQNNQNNRVGRRGEGNQIEQNDIFVQKQVGATEEYAVKHICYMQIETKSLKRLLQICMSLRRQSMHMANGI